MSDAVFGYAEATKLRLEETQALNQQSGTPFQELGGISPFNEPRQILQDQVTYDLFWLSCRSITVKHGHC